jgi:predicted metalloprotease with PDZ domain
MTTKPGEELLLSMIRNGNPLDLSVILGSEVRNEGTSSDRMQKIGIFVDPLNAERKKSYGYDFDQEGVMISKIEIGSPAYKAGLFATDIITGVILGLNTQIQIRNGVDLEEALELAGDQKVLILQVRAVNCASEMLYTLRV